ncbi:dynamin family protein [Paenibacillus piscarius]|uniref:dynamin family protein n=1 Tax=Paenibacillus piscarius TaxID=1089681 RepID=UPI001EE8BB84
MGAERERVEQVTTGSSALMLLEKQLREWGELESAQVIADLKIKEQADELTLAFCGHFSAGKSSMINALCGKPVLPSGPVPTSANIVSIRSGAPKVLLHPQAGGARAQRPVIQTTPDRLQDYCRQGTEYAAIEVWEEIPLLGSHGVLMDTPGVDSTDEGHQAATRSALHLADAVFYVMDYNHVQSENNLAFAKSLSDWGKPLYLIINQIDKHRQHEIPIAEYRQQVESAFREWGIHSAGLLFTSLKVQAHPLNQWQALLGVINGLLEQRRELVDYSLSRSVHHTADEVLAAYREGQEEERGQLLEAAGGSGEAAVQEELRELKQEEALLERLPEQSRQDLRSRLDALLGNTNLMPADLRDAAGAYIESLQPGFRRGLLFTAAKREKEQGTRLAHWHSLQTREITAQLEWHTLQLVRDWAEGLELWQEGAEPLLKQAFPAVSPGWLAAQVKPGTGASGEALLNFCRSLAAEIKAGFRRAVLAFGEQLLDALPPLAAERQASLAGRSASLHSQLRAHAALAALDRAAAARADELAALLPPRRSLTSGALPEVPPLAAGALSAASPESPQRSSAAASPAATEWAAETAQPAGGRRRLTEAAAVLREAAGVLRAEPAMASAARALAARSEDLAGGRFTLALFGAFSAGKSSFANALLGEDVLPVSPHPATAAVGRILAPEGGFANRTAFITMKRAEDFWEDILHSFSVLQLPPPQRERWTAAVDRLQGSGLHPSALPHIGFLRAAAAGWAESGPLLGTERTVSLEEYRTLVADEKRACFIQSTDLYVDSPLTRSGIVLVDTPGADSLHARHTGVTFGYMKNADAICFVTYYNHAFSKADRSLLAQLGRIKDSFALDKMFFIINASDLAADEAELAEVKAHVAQNLRAGGLTSPRIYSVSSLLALEGKSRRSREAYEASGFGSFEAALSAFAGDELPRLSLAAARDSLGSVRLRAEEWQRLARMEAGQREEGMKRLQEQREAARQRLAELEREERPLRDLRREGEELLYHVRQRLAFSFGRSFQESFHPSVLREDGGNLKDIFTACGRELERSIRRELEQELWATTLRLESAGRRFVTAAAAAAARELDFPEQELQLLENAEERWPAPAKLDCLLAPLDWSSLWGRFKSPRHFFEGPGRAEIRAAAEPWCKEAVAAAAEAQEQELLTFYTNAAAESLFRAAGRLREALAEREAAMAELLKGGDSAQHWAGIAGELQRLEQAVADRVNSDL